MRQVSTGKITHRVYLTGKDIIDLIIHHNETELNPIKMMPAIGWDAEVRVELSELTQSMDIMKREAVVISWVENK